MKQEKIIPSSLLPMDMFADDDPLRIELAYARPESFCGIVYRPAARLWLHEDLAAIVVLAARLAHARHGLRLVVYDGLRTMSAQELVCRSPIVRTHPHWLEGEDRVFAPPGRGGHPRAMAVDVELETAEGRLLDMGTAFDELPVLGNGPQVNRAHRAYTALTDEVAANRRMLDGAMADAAAALGLPLRPLPSEWWDFRFPQDVYEKFAPLDDTDLPPQMRMTAVHMNAPGPADFPLSHFARKKAALLQRLPKI